MGEGMIGINNKYIYKGRTLGVWIKNKELGRYEDPHKAPAVEAPAQKKAYVPQKPTAGSAFDDDFPLDFSELGAPSDGGDVEIPV